jgi:hypothetical protein
MEYIPGFREAFPELNRVTSEELCGRWISLDIDFYTEDKTPISKWLRLTLPLALVLALFMWLALPIVFMLTGRWSYPLGEKNRIRNWFKALRLL